tara:strand:- start:3294 stop:4481 length:1188 start_codon:yes stop_codon:yes gene_type:complete
MNFSSNIAKKFMFSSKETGPTRITGIIAVVGIAVGTMAMILSVSVLNGFESKIIDRIIGFEGDVKLRGNFKIYDDIGYIDNINSIYEHVAYKERVGLILTNDKSTRMIKFKSIDLKKIDKFYDLNIESIGKYDQPMIVLGKTTASRMNLRVGDEVGIMSPLDQNSILGMPRQIKVIVGAIFNVQVLDFNDRIAFIDQETGNNLFLRKKFYDGIDIRLQDGHSLNKLQSDILAYSPNSKLETWKELHSNLFSAMKLERLGSLVVLSLIVLVGCFNLSTTLMLTTIQRIKQYGILSTLGATKKTIRNIIIKQGFYTGSIGILIGLLIGLAFVATQNVFGIIKLPSDIYFTSNLPMLIYFKDILLILLISFSMVVTSSMLAAKRTNLATIKNSLVLEK